MPGLPSNLKVFLILPESCWKIDFFLFVLRYSTWKFKFVSSILSIIVLGNIFLLLTRPNPLKRNFCTIYVTMRLFKQFQFTIRQLSCEKMLTFDVLDNYFSDLFTEVQIRYQKTFKFNPRHLFERQSKFNFLTIEAVNKNTKSKRKFCRQS